MKEEIGYFGRGIFGRRLEGVRHCVRHRHHEDQKTEWKSGSSHPPPTEKEETICREAAKKREGQQHDSAVNGQGSSRQIERMSKHQGREGSDEKQDAERDIALILFGQLITPNIKQISRNEWN